MEIDVHAVVRLARELRLAGDRAGAAELIRRHAGLDPLTTEPRDDDDTSRVLGYLEGRQEVTLREVAAALALRVGEDGLWHTAERRVGAVLRAANWKEGRKRVGGKPTWVWRRPLAA